MTTRVVVSFEFADDVTAGEFVEAVEDDELWTSHDQHAGEFQRVRGEATVVYRK